MTKVGPPRTGGPSPCRFPHGRPPATASLAGRTARLPISPDSGFPPICPICPKNGQPPARPHHQRFPAAFLPPPHTVIHCFCAEVHTGAPTPPPPAAVRPLPITILMIVRPTESPVPHTPPAACLPVPAHAAPPRPPRCSLSLTLVLIPLLRHHPAAPRPPGLQHHSAVHPPLRSPPVAGHPPPVANRLPRHDSPQSFRASAVGKYFLTQKQDMQALMHIGAARLPQARRFVQIGLPFLQVIDIQGFIF